MAQFDILGQLLAVSYISLNDLGNVSLLYSSFIELCYCLHKRIKCSNYGWGFRTMAIVYRSLCVGNNLQLFLYNVVSPIPYLCSFCGYSFLNFSYLLLCRYRFIP